MNEITVTLEGKEYQIDIQKAKELGVIKEKDTRCKSWEEFCKEYASKTGYYYDIMLECTVKTNSPLGAYTQLTEKEVESLEAFSKLLKLRRDWIGTWEPNWHNSESKYCIAVCETHIKINSFCAIQQTFSFPTREMAEEFLKCFKDLFEQCKNLI